MTSAERPQRGDGKEFDSAVLVPGQEPSVEKFNYYAWGRLGRLLIERDFKEAYQSTPPGMSFVYLDGCSSTPWLREVMRAQVARHEYLRQANSVINAFDVDFRRRAEGILPRIKRVRQEKIDAARNLLFGQRQLPRQILQAAVFELMFDPEHVVGIKTQREDRLSEYFLDRFHAFPARYLTDKQEQPEGDNGSWRSLVVDEAPVSLADIVGTLTDVVGYGSLTADEAETLMRSIAGHFAHQLAEKVRPSAKFFSLDWEDVNLFRRFAYRNFPIEILKTIFFRNVLDPDRHKVGDIRGLNEFEDGSVSVYSMIEGFPFYADNFTDADALQIVSEATRVLRYGGKFIAFPWIATDGKDLSTIEDSLRGLGFDVKIEDKKKDQLLGNMSERELALVKRSPVFTLDPDKEFLPLLVATKMAK